METVDTRPAEVRNVSKGVARCKSLWKLTKANSRSSLCRLRAAAVVRGLLGELKPRSWYGFELDEPV